MRLSSVPLVLAGASLAIQVGAAPLRVVVISSHHEVTADGAHSNAEANVVAAMPGPALMPGAGMMRVDHKSTVHPGDKMRAHHCGSSLRETLKAFSSRIFGFPSTAVDAVRPHPHAGMQEHPYPEPGRVSILPWLGTPNDFADVEGESESGHRHHSRPPMATASVPMAKDGMGHTIAQSDAGPVRIVHVSEKDGSRMRFRRRHGPFLRRMHFALMSLGPWEGRAVAFVLGCGIGVLLRMVWVMGVVLIRTISGRKAEDDTPEAVFDADAEEILVAPPQYTMYPDEKASAAAEDKPQEA